jgi:NADPH-dependent 2,4-dienoyl-CoA reductase/sulfur reductase-like enzyme
MRDRGECLNQNLNWLQQRVSKVDPDNNTLYVENNESPLTYDFLVMCSGVELRYDLIEGSLEALNDKECPVGSMYRLDFAHKMSDLRSNFKSGKAIFTLPTMPVKCGGAPQKIMYLSEDTWRKNKVRKNIDMHWYTSAGGMFPVKKYGDALKPLAISKGIDLHF